MLHMCNIEAEFGAILHTHNRSRVYLIHSCNCYVTVTIVPMTACTHTLQRTLPARKSFNSSIANCWRSSSPFKILTQLSKVERRLLLLPRQPSSRHLLSVAIASRSFRLDHTCTNTTGRQQSLTSKISMPSSASTMTSQQRKQCMVIDSYFFSEVREALQLGRDL